jgi:hypothetical protein
MSKKLTISILVLTGILLLNSVIPSQGSTGTEMDASGTSTAVARPGAAGASPVGPDTFPSKTNPLTGLPVENPDHLRLPPALVSVTNFPATARPQAGLSFSPYVFEIYIGYGMTRFLALFYGDYPEVAIDRAGPAGGEKAAVGPIRSGRLPYEDIRSLYNGFLVMAGASSEVGAQLFTSTTVFGSDASDINSAMMDVSQLERVAQAHQKNRSGALNLAANRFERARPEGGEAAEKIWVFYNYLNQIQWDYDPASHAYLRSQDNADGSGKFYPSTDRLTGEQLAFKNVVILFADHQALSPSLIGVDLLYTTRPALLFRDGRVYRIFWSTANGEYEKKTGLLRPIRFVDAQGSPFPMKPGQTWVQIVTSTTTLQEFNPGEWKIRFYAP